MNKYTFLVLIVSMLCLFTGCTSKSPAKTADYQTIAADKAYEIISANSNVIILDVRTESEYLSGHISNAISLPLDEIAMKADTVLTEKDATILVYCQSGRRSALAAKQLCELGYSAIQDFGGINDWPYEVTTD